MVVTMSTPWFVSLLFSVNERVDSLMQEIDPSGRISELTDDNEDSGTNTQQSFAEREESMILSCGRLVDRCSRRCYHHFPVLTKL
jgi:hypothetical protein